MSPDELRNLPGGNGPVPSNGSWGGSPAGYYPPGFVHPAVHDPNYVIENHGAFLFPLTVALVVLTSVVVFARVLSRFILRTIGLDDWFIIAATLSTIAVSVTICLAALKGGIGKHWYDISWPEREYGSYQIMVIHGAIYTCTIFFTKLSILVFLRRLFENTSRWMDRLILVYIYFNCIFFIVSVICLTTLDASSGLLYSVAGIHLALEVAILILPVRMIWRLKIPWGQKLMSVLILATGGLVCVVSALRIQVFAPYLNGIDESFVNRKLYLFAIVECSLGILAASAPSMKSACTKFMDPSVHWMKKNFSSRTYGGDSTENLRPKCAINISQCRESLASIEEGKEGVRGVEPGDVGSLRPADEESGLSQEELEARIQAAIELGYWNDVDNSGGARDPGMEGGRLDIV